MVFKPSRDFIKSYALSGPHFGRIVAEEDVDLARYYVQPERYVNRATDPNDPAIFFVGPKGIGKSAILQMIRLGKESEVNRIINLSPDDLAFSAIANIEANTPLLQDAGRNQWLFKSLWDYVLALEVLRREYRTEGSLESYLRGVFRGQHEREARRLLRISLGDSGAPVSLSEKILHLVKEVELSADVQDVKVSGKVGVDPAGSTSASHLNLLGLVNSVAKSVADQLKSPYFILIDDLDRHWNNSPIQNSFVAALFTSLRNFSKPPFLKCVVAMRDHIYKALPLHDRDKYHDWVCHVKWDKPAIKRMITIRIQYKLGCASTDVWGGAFPETAFDKMWRYSTGRPRELIRLSTLCLEKALEREGKSVEEDDLSEAMKVFSDDRIIELASENAHLFQPLEPVLRRFSGWPKEFAFKKFDKDFAEYVGMEAVLKEAPAVTYSWIGGYMNDGKALARAFLIMGFFLIKPSRTAEPREYDPNQPLNITDDTWLAIHPTFWFGLGLIGA